MTDALIDNINAFDKFIAQFFTGKFYGLAELVNGQGESFPVTAVAVKRDRISPADTWQLQTYHRILSAGRADGLEEFGRQKEYFVSMRYVVIANPNLGEGFIFRLLDKFPDQTVTPAGFTVIEDAYQVNMDHPAIAQAEFGNAWEDKHRLTKNIWFVNYTMRLTLSDCK